MKRLIRYPQQIKEKWEIEWTIDIYPKIEYVQSATSILDTSSEEYINFIAAMISEFSNAGFELYNDPRYTHPSNIEGSQSDYYTFLQIRDQVLIEVVVHVRISDHPMTDKRWGTAAQRRAAYLNRVSAELKEEYQLDYTPQAIPVDIIFRDEENDRYLKSYIAAMFKLRSEIAEIKEQIDSLWKGGTTNEKINPG